MKRVLIVTYYWPPNGGSGVQRWLKFAKYLPEFGWEPIIFTPENPLIAQRDESLMRDVAPNLEVLRWPIWDPVAKLQERSGNPNVGLLQKEKSATWKTKVITWLRGNLLIPDPKIFWVRPAVKYLTAYLQAHPVDVVVTTGPPHSMHLIGLRLQQQLGVKWVADFRDPWTRIYYFKSLMPSRLSTYLHQRLERKVLQNADQVIAASEQIRLDFEEIRGSKVHKITNGFDSSDFDRTHPVPQKFVIGHVGNFTATQHHEPFWEALSALVQENEDFRSQVQVRLVGNVDVVIKSAIERHGLETFVDFVPYVPHNQVPETLSGMWALLLFINQTGNAKIILTGKLFEYMASQRRIFAIGPEGGELEQILKSTQCGEMLDFKESTGVIKDRLLHLFKDYLRGVHTPENLNVAAFTRRNLTQELSQILYDCSD